MCKICTLVDRQVRVSTAKSVCQQKAAGMHMLNCTAPFDAPLMSFQATRAGRCSLASFSRIPLCKGTLSELPHLQGAVETSILLRILLVLWWWHTV